MNLNKVFILGNLTRDPELRNIPSGQAVCSFSIATNRLYTDKSGQKQKLVEYHNIVAWGKLGELCKQYLAKGRSALVEGRMQTRSWDDKQTGQKKYKTDIVAENVQFGPRVSGGQQDAESGNNGRQATPSPKEEALETVQYPADEDEINPEDIPF
ncbi:MAG: single-stranded DNA-binding protein [Candidatus Sungbacteria bacterium]|nr:single-stranded DNA-binding protein [Candidatus Sungbacteria bacterium]